jgi:hypothetical protein
MIATELLMPRDIFKAAIGAVPRIERVFELANVFQTSIAATALRFCDVGAAMLAFETNKGVVVWRKGLPRTIPDGLADRVRTAESGRPVEAQVLLDHDGSFRVCLVDGKPMGSNGRTIFVGWPDETQ